ncbi:hypothetical protein FQN60_016821 [Etheostoma spectabile]|uniref:Uncharacterized protein n=1 Tax=Etheostoma spectabile TaxID=54343 RepID=A0A5J5C9I4_9PERO|nr:hypothetical protein FQN60_016821 [Etheostoma spectabile]
MATEYFSAPPVLRRSRVGCRTCWSSWTSHTVSNSQLF